MTRGRVPHEWDKSAHETWGYTLKDNRPYQNQVGVHSPRFYRVPGSESWIKHEV